MCGRFVRYSPVAVFAGLFDAEGHPEDRPSYNIAPGSRILVARLGRDGHRQLALLKWGLVPAWSDEPKTAYATINARAETVADKPAFRSAFRHRRCLIAADGFYEWQPQPDGHKQPYYVHLSDRQPFAFAGIWEHWTRDGRTPLDSCSILVTAANSRMRPIHERMPVILPPDRYADWLDPGTTDPAALQPLLAACPAARISLHPVSTVVNNPRNDGPDLLHPREADTP